MDRDDILKALEAGEFDSVSRYYQDRTDWSRHG